MNTRIYSGGKGKGEKLALRDLCPFFLLLDIRLMAKEKTPVSLSLSLFWMQMHRLEGIDRLEFSTRRSRFHRVLWLQVLRLRIDSLVSSPCSARSLCFPPEENDRSIVPSLRF